jgi:hypothetical protein
MEARRKRKIGEGGNVIVGEVNSILVLTRHVSQPPDTAITQNRAPRRRLPSKCQTKEDKLTFATPRFSITGIL